MRLPETYSAKNLDYDAQRELERLFGTIGQRTPDGRFYISILPIFRDQTVWREALEYFGLVKKECDCDDEDIFARRAYDLEPCGGDETGNLLDMQRSLVAELRRMLNRVDAQNLGYETAGDILFRADQMARYVDMTARALQELNLRLFGFGVADFSVDEAKPIVGELAVFLERFGRRFGTLREDILRDIEEMRRECHRKRWNACAEVMKAEASRFRHIASVKVPNSERILSDASFFYGAGGTLVSLMSRVGDSARKVWGKLNAKLRELERCNHRIEDIAKRLEEIAAFDEDYVPHGWLASLLEQANMKGDAQARPGGEKSLPPMPKKSSQKNAEKIVSWITPRKVGERPDVASIAEEKARRMREWMELMRYKRAFEAFFDKFFGWKLVMDAKCARLYKPKWFNEKITLPNRDMFTFTKRDECMAFLLLLEFFERECREQCVTADDRENLRFRFGDLLEYASSRFRALMSGKEENYTDERVRQILKGIMPQLEKYRFLHKVKPSADDSVSEIETIFECLPAMWHYQAAELAKPVTEE